MAVLIDPQTGKVFDPSIPTAMALSRRNPDPAQFNTGRNVTEVLGELWDASKLQGLAPEMTPLGSLPNLPIAAKTATNAIGTGAKAGAREIARQIETGTGVFGKGTIDPRMYVYKPTFPSKPLPEGVGSTFERTQVKDLLPTKDLNAEDLRGASLFTFPADSTSYGMRTESISGNKIKPEYQNISQGGIPFGRSVEHQSKDIAFASNENAAKNQHNRYELERERNLANNGSGRIFVAPNTMADFSEAFSTQPVFQLNSMVRSQGLTPKELEVIDDMVRNTRVGNKYPYKNWVGMADSKAREQLLTGIGVDANKTDLRKKVYEKYASKTGQKTLDYNIEDLRGSLLDPNLFNAPDKNLGNLWYEVNFNKGITPSSAGSGHVDYSHDMGGNYLGTTQMKPVKEVFGNVYNDIYSAIPKIDKNGKIIPEFTRELNTINSLRDKKDNASLFINDIELERLKRLFQL